MAISVVMPALEMAQETGKLISWLKKEGESVTKGEPLLEVETDKAVMEIESPGVGVLAGVKVQAGTEVPVGRTIAWIVSPGEAAPADEIAAASPAPVNSGSPVSRLMAERTTQSWTTIPHFFVMREVDAGALNEARQKLGPEIEESHGVKLTHSDLLLALVARVLHKHPRINACWTGEGVRTNDEINIGL